MPCSAGSRSGSTSRGAKGLRAGPTLRIDRKPRRVGAILPGRDPPRPADRQLMVLERAAQFFVSDDPAQAEAYCRQILETAAVGPARRTLVRALAEQGGEQRLREAAQVLMEVGRFGGSTAADRRLEAILLARTGRPEDRQRPPNCWRGSSRFRSRRRPGPRPPGFALRDGASADAGLRTVPGRLATRRVPADRSRAVRRVPVSQRGEQPQFADYAEPVLTRLDQNPKGRIGAVRLRLVAARKIPQETRRRANPTKSSKTPPSGS